MKPKTLVARWNKDLSITLYHRGKKLIRREIVLFDTHEDTIAPFCQGWFGTEDQSKWKVRWVYAN